MLVASIALKLSVFMADLWQRAVGRSIRNANVIIVPYYYASVTAKFYKAVKMLGNAGSISFRQ